MNRPSTVICAADILVRALCLRPPHSVSRANDARLDINASCNNNRSPTQRRRSWDRRSPSHAWLFAFTVNRHVKNWQSCVPRLSLVKILIYYPRSPPATSAKHMAACVFSLFPLLANSLHFSPTAINTLSSALSGANLAFKSPSSFFVIYTPS